MRLKPRSFAYMKSVSGDCLSPRTPRLAGGEEELAGDLGMEPEEEGDDDEVGPAAPDAAESGRTRDCSWKLIDKRALSSVTPYTDDLMYLDDRFQEIALMLRIAFERQQKVTKQARGSDESAAGAGVYDRPRIFNVKEMEGKLRLTSSRSPPPLGLTAPRLTWWTTTWTWTAGDV